MERLLTLEDIEFRSKHNILDWCDISYNQKLSENVIIQFQDKVDWKGISYQQNLSEDFIREFQDKIDWHILGYNELKLSDEFILEFIDKLNLESMLRYQKLTPEIREYMNLLIG